MEDYIKDDLVKESSICVHDKKSSSKLYICYLKRAFKSVNPLNTTRLSVFVCSSNVKFFSLDLEMVIMDSNTSSLTLKY